MIGLLANPVLAREMRTRMRGRRAGVLITFWLAFNGAVLAIAYLAAENVAEERFGFDRFANTVAISRGVYEWTLFAMLLLMVLIVPGQAAGAIAGERERQTLVPLQVTLLTPWRILVGKILASVVFLALLVVLAMPLLAVGYLLGGIGIADIIAGAGAVLVAGLLLAAMCTAVSTFVRRVQGATVLSYALVLALTVGTFIGYGAAAVVDQSRGPDQADPPAALLLPNPLALVSDIVGDFEDSELISPFDGIHRILNEREDFADLDGAPFGPDMSQQEEMPFGPDVARQGDMPFGPKVAGQREIPFWIGSLVMLSLCSLAGLGLAARRLDTPAETER